MTVETDPIRVFAEDGKWLVDYGSYAHGYHSSRSEAIETATSAARREKRELVVEARRPRVHQVIAPERSTYSPSEPAPASKTWEPNLHDQVRVPGGREGKVIGFYRRDSATALVHFGPDDCTEFSITELEPSWIGWD